MQLKKADLPIDFIDDGIVICLSEVHEEKALFPIDVTDDGIVICVRDFLKLKSFAEKD